MQSAVHIVGAEPSRLPVGDFTFDLPPELIAQEPARERPAARLLVWNRSSVERSHHQVADLSRYVREGDLFVFNDTKVVPARLYGRTESGAAVELLVIRRSPHRNPLPEETVDLLANSASTSSARAVGDSISKKNSAHPELVEGAASRLSTVPEREGAEWQCLGRPSKRFRPGVAVRFGDHASAVIRGALGDGRYDVAFDTDDVLALLAAHGEVPLPPYIKRPDGPLPFDGERYQTVYASQPGAIAAPTAGLHFTSELLDELRAAGGDTAFLTLHVGPGTFLPIRGDDLDHHVMDAEWCAIPAATAARVNAARRDGRRVIAVGTTTTRALESAVDGSGTVCAGARWADQFIRPGYGFRAIDALFTNFHLPGSTLLALVSAFAGRERTLAVYEEAVRMRYRFYSYGDAMLIQ